MKNRITKNAKKLLSIFGYNVLGSKSQRNLRDDEYKTF